MSDAGTEQQEPMRPRRGTRHAVGVTRMCLKSGSVQLPRSLADVLPEGEILVLDTQRDQRVALWSEPPRTLRDLGPVFEAHEIMVNDELVLEQEGNEFRLSFDKRPRRAVPSVQASTWKSLEEPAPPLPPVTTTAPMMSEAEPANPQNQDDAMLGGVEQDAWSDSDAWEDDVPRAPTIRQRNPRPAPRAWEEQETFELDELPEERPNPLAGFLQAVRSFFQGRQEEEDHSNLGPNVLEMGRREPTDSPAAFDAWDDADESPDDTWDAPTARVSDHRRLQEPDVGAPGGPSTPSQDLNSRRRADVPPGPVAAASGGTSTAIGPASVAPPSTPLFPTSEPSLSESPPDVATSDERGRGEPSVDAASSAPVDEGVVPEPAMTAETPTPETTEKADATPDASPTVEEKPKRATKSTAKKRTSRAAAHAETADVPSEEVVVAEDNAAAEEAPQANKAREDDESFLGGDLRTRLLRFLRHPEMPVVAKSELIAKRFDLDISTANELLADISEDPPEGLRLTPVREGAWRIERRLD